MCGGEDKCVTVICTDEVLGGGGGACCEGCSPKCEIEVMYGFVWMSLWRVYVLV